MCQRSPGKAKRSCEKRPSRLRREIRLVSSRPLDKQDNPTPAQRRDGVHGCVGRHMARPLTPRQSRALHSDSASSKAQPAPEVSQFHETSGADELAHVPHVDLATSV